MIKLIIGVAFGVAFWLELYHNPEWVANFFLWIIGIILRPFRYLFGLTEAQKEKRALKKEEQREKEYQEALARWDKDAQVSKENYFIMKPVREKEAEAKKIQAKIDKYWSNISDEEVERVERIKKQKAEYDALPQWVKDKKAKKKKRDWIVIIIALLFPYIVYWLLILITSII